jgi:hypothetical protein
VQLKGEKAIHSVIAAFGQEQIGIFHKWRLKALIAEAR